MKYWRRVDSIMEELDAWKDYYDRLRKSHDSQAVQLKAFDRLKDIDNLWHELAAARDTLAWLS